MLATADLNQILLRSVSYRTFLNEAFQKLKATRRGTSLAQLARKIGCRSKSYPREVMNGRRALSLHYAALFADAFGLKGEAKKLFVKMVESERFPERHGLQSEIQKSKSRIRQRTNRS